MSDPTAPADLSPPSAPVVLVTGDSSGLGRATAERLSRSGFIVYGASRSAPSGASGWRHLAMDVTDEASVSAAVETVVAERGRLDAVVHFAGASLSGPVEEITLAEAQRHFDVNYFGTVRVLRAALPVMRHQRHGRLVVIGSIAGLIGLGYLAHYGAAKAALDRLVEGLRAEVAEFGIDAVIVHPGDFRTEISSKSVKAAATCTQSPYEPMCTRRLAFYAQNEARAPDPDILARIIERLLAAGRPPPRVVVGQALERLGLVGKRLLPGRLFERLLAGIYRS